MKIKFNLLPPKQKKHLKTQKMFRTIIEQEIHVIVILLFLGLSLYSMYFILNSKTTIISDAKNKITTQEHFKDIKIMHDKITGVHNTIDAVDKLNSGHFKWSKLFVVISESIPESIKINTMKTSDNAIVLKGTAETREDIIELKEIFRSVVMNDVQCFEEIVVPESELTKPVDVTFTMTIKANLSCLK